MNSNLINFLVGYFIVINLAGIALIYLKTNTKLIKIKKGILNLIIIILSAIGGFIGVLVGNEMLNYDMESKLFRRWIPLLIFIEICIGLFIVYKNI